MIKSARLWPTGALLLALALSGCTGQAAPEPAESTSYRLVEDLCERLEHAWITEFTGAPVTYKSDYPGRETTRRCSAGSWSADKRKLISVQVTTSTVGGIKPQPAPAEPLDGVGDQAYVYYGEPLTHVSELLGGETTNRMDRLLAAQGSANVMLYLTISAPSVPDDAAVQAVLTEYGKDVFALMAESPNP
ncbi:hypothetical protein [Melissospora conviva]|uniref:hypothetical protein n=1 Tax=Melissospora conviva TaxID=3388432 RepID=UPI003C137F4D